MMGLGILLIIFGLMTISSPKYYSARYQHTFDFTEYRFLAGGVMIAIGIAYVLITAKKNRDKKDLDKEK